MKTDTTSLIISQREGNLDRLRPDAEVHSGSNTRFRLFASLSLASSADSSFTTSAMVLVTVGSPARA